MGAVTRKESQLNIPGIIARVEALSPIKVGLLEGLGEHPNSGEGLSIVNIGAINEFGAQNGVPERPFIRATMAENVAKYLELKKGLLKKVLSGAMAPERAVGLLGAQVEADIKMAIDRWDSPPNAPETEDRKGANNPLVDTGLMKQSVAWSRAE